MLDQLFGVIMIIHSILLLVVIFRYIDSLLVKSLFSLYIILDMSSPVGSLYDIYFISSFENCREVWNTLSLIVLCKVYAFVDPAQMNTLVLDDVIIYI